MRRAVLHIDTETTWRGGENQLRLLLEHAPAGWEWHVAVPPGSAAAGRLAGLSRVIELPMRGAAQVAAAFRLAAYVRRHRIAVVDCHTGRAHTVGLLVRALVPGCRLVVHRRVDVEPGAGWVHRRKYLDVRVDRFVCISARIAAVLRRYGVDEARLRVVRSAADAAAFQDLDRAAQGARLRAAWGVAADMPIIGHVAHLSAEKDQATLLGALARLRDDGVTVFAFIAGDGPCDAALRAQAAELDLGGDRLRFLGRRRDVPELLAAADVFVLSSVQEGLGSSLLDAAQAGCALAATAAGGIPEVVRDEATGLLAPPGDDAALARQLARLLRDAGLRRRLADAARRLVRDEFSVEAMTAGNLAVYAELLPPAGGTD